MIAKILIVAVLCVSYALAEAPRYRNQRFRQAQFRQAPPRQFFARQEAPYPESSGGEPAAEYGPPKPTPTYGPPPTTPASSYGPPAEAPSDVEPAQNPDTEVVAAPSRFTQFSDKLALPATKPPQKFSQRLELQQQVKQFPNQQQQQVVTPFVAPVAAAPVQFATPVVAAPAQFAAPAQLVAPAQFGAIQQEGSYYIQLPSGSIQRVNYLTQPSVADNAVVAQLQFRPVAEVQATVNQPELYVNTVVQSQVSTDE